MGVHRTSRINRPNELFTPLDQSLTHLWIENDFHRCAVATGTKSFVKSTQWELMRDQCLGVHPPLGEKLDSALPGCPHIPERTNDTQFFHRDFIKVRMNLSRIDSHWQ